MTKTQVALLAWFALFSVTFSGAASRQHDGFRLLTDDGGILRVPHERLVAAGLEGEPPTSRMALFDSSQPRPLWVDDGGDGRFGPGDALFFMAAPAPRDGIYHGDPTRRAYTLRLDTTPGKSARTLESAPADGGSGPLLEAVLDLERDVLREAVIGAGGPGSDTWFWAELTHVDTEPFVLPLALDGLDRSDERPVVVRIELLGRSKLNPRQRLGGAQDHRLEARLGGSVAGTFDWDSSGERHAIEVTVPAARLAGDGVELSLRVPARVVGHDPAAPPAVDVVLLDRVEVRYPRDGRLGAPQVALTVAAAGDGNCVALLPEVDGTPVVWRADGLRLRSTPPDATGRRVACTEAGWEPGLEWTATVGAVTLEPAVVERLRPPRLATTTPRADYVMITHPTLYGALEPLAAFHRDRGLAVEIVSVDDVYDEFNDGVRHPVAIRRFLEHAFHNWTPPAPRFVLLAGDASWDRRAPGHRDLVPTTTTAGRYGHAASDNPFACVAGDDDRPDLALGRLPAATPDELRSMVDKTIRHATHDTAGVWKRSILWLTDAAASSRQRSDFMAGRLSAAGFTSTRIYASGNAPAEQRQALFAALDSGHTLVHFYGHGGRFVWRTGPPDPGRNRELFSMRDLDELRPAEHFPVVVGLTCYSAPFDHPTEDSIGERFLRLPDRGAVAFIAAGWRNTPTLVTTRHVTERLTQPGTVGEALMRAKGELGAAFRAQYNLLGDPALPLALPALAVRVYPLDGGTRIRAEVDDADFSGRAIVDWVDAWGGSLASAELDVANGGMEASPPGDSLDGVAGAVVYVWNASTGVDGMGGVRFVEGEGRP